MKNISKSATVSINSLAQQKQKEGVRIFNFAAGDPQLTTHDYITEYVLEAVHTKHCPYPPVAGLDELRQQAAWWLNSQCGSTQGKENILVTCGGKFALFALLHTLLRSPEDEVLVMAPYWPSYVGMVELIGAKVSIVQASASSGWKVSEQELQKKLTKKSKILIFNNATNPTGTLYSKEQIKAILLVAKQAGLKVIADEVYSGLAYDKSMPFISCSAFKEYSENTFIVQSCSKNFAMTGWRVGFAIAPEAIIQKLCAFQSQSITAVPLISQWAALAALQRCHTVEGYVKQAMQKRRDLFITHYNALFPTPIASPPAGLYAFVPLSSLGLPTHMTAIAFCEQMMSAHNIALVPGEAFGQAGYVRFAYSSSAEDISEGLQALAKAITNL